jgi:hypothetical protein
MRAVLALSVLSLGLAVCPLVWLALPRLAADAVSALRVRRPDTTPCRGGGRRATLGG